VLNVAFAKSLFAYKRVNMGDARFGFVYGPNVIQIPEAGHLFDGRMRDRCSRDCIAAMGAPGRGCSRDAFAPGFCHGESPDGRRELRRF
jgi:hypothetical protein